MKILGIETSCDETAVCLLDCEGSLQHGTFSMKILGNALHSQIENHKEFGGVVPMMAKREHAKNLIPLFLKVLKEVRISNINEENIQKELSEEQVTRITEIFGRETEFKDNFINEIKNIASLPVDAIAVTEGPGLEPALWMGIIFAQALSYIFDIPLVPVNHMEGHILSAFVQTSEIKMGAPTLPLLALLISGGHTELVLMKEWGSYQIIGETRDDAVGEAFDKVARMLGLPYPGGPEISKLAESGRILTHKTSTSPYILPRPMINSKDYDFSFSGLKTAVLYSLKDQETQLQISKEVIAKEFEDAVTEVLISKTLRAIEEFNIKTLVLGGGVVSNEYIRSTFKEKLQRFPEVTLLIPLPELRTDNALMIAVAGYGKFQTLDTKGHSQKNKSLRPSGSLKLC